MNTLSLLKKTFNGLSLGLIFAFSSAPALADSDKDKKHEYKHEQKKESHKSAKHEQDNDRYRYSKHDDDDHHERHYKSDDKLPPGLANRHANTGKPLPPGWQKKLHRGEVMEREVYQHGREIGPIDAQGRITIDIDGKLFRLYKNTREIIDILN